MTSARWLTQPGFKNVLPLQSMDKPLPKNFSGTYQARSGSCVMLNSQIGITACHMLGEMNGEKCPPYSYVITISFNKHGHPNQERYEVYKIYLHHDYPRSDLAVFTLKKPILNINSINLDEKAENYSNYVYTGYSCDEFPVKNKIPRMLGVRSVDQKNEIITDNFIPFELSNCCTQDKLRTRGGMSGGGLFKGNRLVGIHSVVSTTHAQQFFCGNCNYSTLATSIDFHRDWLNTTIESATKDLVACHDEPDKTKEKDEKNVSSSEPLLPKPDLLIMERDSKSTTMPLPTLVNSNQCINNLVELVDKIIRGHPKAREFWISQFWTWHGCMAGLPRGIHLMEVSLECASSNEMLLMCWMRDLKLERERNRFFCEKPYHLYVETYQFYQCFRELNALELSTIEKTYEQLIIWIKSYGNDYMQSLIKDNANVNSLKSSSMLEKKK